MKKLNRTSILLFFFFFSFSFSFSSTFVASGDNTITLYNATDLIELSNDVADGTSYAGTTILLGADLDFSGSLSEEFNPIGKDYIIEFKGSFDGQGHVISNLAINSSEQFVGLFGCTNATDIRNIVLDASCSVLNNYVSEPNVAYTGGIIGYANPLEKSNSNAVVEGCVNMASVTFAGNTMGNDSSIITVGGIVSFFLPDYYNMVLKNCINYGTIVYSGASSLTSIGGITGAFFNPQTSSDNMCIINNCANYGSFIHNGTTARIYTIGGIIGTAVHSIIENCLSLGSVTTTEESAAIGMIIGALNGYTTIKHCFWVAKENITNSYGYKLITDPTVTDSYLVELNETTLNLLNDWAGSNRSAYRDWMTLYLKGGSFGSTGNEIAIVIKTAFPDPTKEGHNFDGWCTDDNCTDGVYRGGLNGTTTALYAHWTINNYTISFDYMNGLLLKCASASMTPSCILRW